MKYCGGNPDGLERRANGKIKLTVGDYIRITILICTLFVSGLTGWLTMKWKTNANAQDIAEASTERVEMRGVNKQQNDDIRDLTNDVQHIKEDVGEIKAVQSDNTELLNRIWGKLDAN